MPENHPHPAVEQEPRRRRMRSEETAAYLGIREPTLRWWRMKGKGPIYAKIGRICIYDSLDCDNFLEAHLVADTRGKITP